MRWKQMPALISNLSKTFQPIVENFATFSGDGRQSEQRFLFKNCLTCRTKTAKALFTFNEQRINLSFFYFIMIIIIIIVVIVTNCLVT